MNSAVLQNINGDNIEDDLDMVMNSKTDDTVDLQPSTDHHYDPSFVSNVSPPTLSLSKVNT